ncbi:MAG: glucose-6-phosphate isomerase [Rubrivivax sp.]|nr:glucose-6-phosphate isomerase [Rubrivivax sp.]
MNSAGAAAAAPSWPRCDRTRAWVALQGHYEAHGRDLDLREAFARDPRRFETLSFAAPEVFVDLSKQRIDLAGLRFALDLARECGLEARRDAMLGGAVANPTEGRAVLHTALRAPSAGSGGGSDSGLFSREVHGVLDAMLAFAEQVRARAAAGELTDIVNIGIGGSDLGPAMAVGALQADQHPLLRFHFVSNVDGHDIAPLLGTAGQGRAQAGLDPRKSLFVIASKTFTTQETMTNAALARAWFVQRAPEADLGAHFVGVTTNLQAAAAFGITRTFGFWDWVGGRYSLWGAVGLPIAIAVGEAGFRAFLAGARALDEHFAHEPLERNVPVLLGLVDVWNRNFHGFTSRCVAPYHQWLARLPAYLQQLEMESNGKGVDLAGEPLPFATSPVVWGEPGTNGQHAFFQMLHQGTDVVPVEFIAVREAAHGYADSHAKLLANCLAQSQALMLGKSEAEAAAEAVPTAAKDFERARLARHRRFPGNRPCTTLVLERLTPRTLGALVALYEHRVWTAGALWNINSFDQWGVELGKALANRLLPRLESPADAAGSSGDAGGLDGSTAGLLKRLAPKT